MIKKLIIYLVILSNYSLANSSEFPQGKWGPKDESSEQIFICSEAGKVTVERLYPNGRKEEFVLNSEEIKTISDIYILDLNFKTRTIYKLILVKRGNGSNLELLGDLHFYMNGLAHANVFDVYLSYQGEGASCKNPKWSEKI